MPNSQLTEVYELGDCKATSAAAQVMAGIGFSLAGSQVPSIKVQTLHPG